VEALSPPPGVPGEPPPPSDEPPQTPTAARLAFTFLARELGRELRMRHGVELETNADGLEQSQRYLREALADGRVRTAEERREVMRHGAFLSELLARRLGAKWVDVESPDPGRWAMVVPSALPGSENLRVWPFGRVLRFVVMGHKERDLVSYYLDLEARAR
jgi:transposase InsO family protein